MDDALHPSTVLARCGTVARRQWRLLAIVIALDAAPAIDFLLAWRTTPRRAD